GLVTDPPDRAPSARYPHRPLLRADQSREHLEEGSLAGAVRPEDGEGLARREVEGHAVEGDHLSSPLAEGVPQAFSREYRCGRRIPGDSVRRRIACKSAAASTHPRRTALCAAGRGRGTPWWANICGSPPPSTVGSARAALQLEQVVELGQHQQESQLLVGPAQAHRQPALRGLPL